MNRPVDGTQLALSERDGVEIDDRRSWQDDGRRRRNRRSGLVDLVLGR